MKPFGLQTVLDYRKRLEDAAQHKLVEARNVYVQIQKRFQTEERKLRDTLAERQRKEEEGISITELIRYEDHVERLERNLVAIRKTLQEKEHLVREAQAHLMKKAQEKQILEKLKESQNNAWRRYLDKKEALMLDEIAIIRHGREDHDL